MTLRSLGGSDISVSDDGKYRLANVPYEKDAGQRPGAPSRSPSFPQPADSESVDNPCRSRCGMRISRLICQRTARRNVRGRPHNGPGSVVASEKPWQGSPLSGPYDVVVDGERAGSVEMNHTIEIPVEPGSHTLQVRDGRDSSSTQTFDAAEEEIAAFRCTGKRFLPVFLASFCRAQVGTETRSRVSRRRRRGAHQHVVIAAGVWQQVGFDVDICACLRTL